MRNRTRKFQFSWYKTVYLANLALTQKNYIAAYNLYLETIQRMDNSFILSLCGKTFWQKGRETSEFKESSL